MAGRRLVGHDLPIHLTIRPSNDMDANQLRSFMAQHLYHKSLFKQHGDALRKGIPPNRVILVISTTCSASFLLTRGLHMALGQSYLRTTYHPGSANEELYPPTLLDHILTKRVIDTAHLMATEANLGLIRSFNLTPIFLTRDLLDIAVSARDYMVKRATERRDAEAATPDDELLLSMSESEQYDRAIDLTVTRTIQQYAGWVRAERACDWLSLHHCTYKSLKADEPGTVCRMAERYGYTITTDHAAQALAALTDKQTFKNKAVSGRGQKLLSAEQKHRIERMCGYFPDVCFQRVGWPFITPAPASAVMTHPLTTEPSRGAVL